MKGKALIILAIVLCAVFFAFAFGLRRGFDLYRGWKGVLCEFVQFDFAVHIANYRRSKWEFIWWYL